MPVSGTWSASQPAPAAAGAGSGAADAGAEAATRAVRASAGTASEGGARGGR